MRFFLDRDISSATTLWDGLLRFFGFGKIHARYASIKLGIRKDTKLATITRSELNHLDKKFRTKNFLVGRSLERERYLKTSELIAINCYRAMRIKQGLPNRGQRTHTNAKTAKKLSKLWESSKFAQKAAKKLTIKKKFSLNNYLKEKKRKERARIIELKQIQDKNRNNLKQTVNKNNPNILNKHANKA